MNGIPKQISTVWAVLSFLLAISFFAGVLWATSQGHTAQDFILRPEFEAVVFGIRDDIKDIKQILRDQE